MVNNRNDYDQSDESEYHFSDDDVSYEVENEPAAKPAEKSSKASRVNNMLANMSQSRRMIISAVVFIVLVFIVYKMVAPSNTPPSTDITAAPAPTMAQRAPAPAISTTQATAMPAQVQPVAPQQPVQQPAMASAMQPAAPVTVATAPSMQAPAPAAMPTEQPMQVAAAPVQPQPPVQAVQQQMPAVIPVQSPVPTSYVTPPPAAGTAIAQPVTDAASLSATSQQLMNQMNAAYQQKMSEYDAQTKATQEQMQMLTSRVAMMESQINQLVQALTRQNTVQEAPQAPPVVESKSSSYSVQAIIPGRAWLRSANGETVTVTENDMIKDLGRVTKIDPYNGVVEINTGTKVISLAYGVAE